MVVFYRYQYQPTFNNCTFQENQAPNSNNGGGGVYIQSQAQPIFNHVIWIRNVAQWWCFISFIPNQHLIIVHFKKIEASNSKWWTNSTQGLNLYLIMSFGFVM